MFSLEHQPQSQCPRQILPALESLLCLGPIFKKSHYLAFRLGSLCQTKGRTAQTLLVLREQPGAGALAGRARPQAGGLA